MTGPSGEMQGLSARLQEPQLYALTYKVRRWRRLPFKFRETWEKVCTWDEALAAQSEMRALGVTDCVVRRV